jgi:hypothetical protein
MSLDLLERAIGQTFECVSHWRATNLSGDIVDLRGQKLTLFDVKSRTALGWSNGEVTVWLTHKVSSKIFSGFTEALNSSKETLTTVDADTEYLYSNVSILDHYDGAGEFQ